MDPTRVAADAIEAVTGGTGPYRQAYVDVFYARYDWVDRLLAKMRMGLPEGEARLRVDVDEDGGLLVTLGVPRDPETWGLFDAEPHQGTGAPCTT